MGAFTRGGDNSVGCAGSFIDQNGIVGKHTYSILSAHQRGSNLVVHLRNPWGNTEWLGELADQIDDGIFQMLLRDSIAYFSFVTVCYVRECRRHDLPKGVGKKSNSIPEFYRRHRPISAQYMGY